MSVLIAQNLAPIMFMALVVFLLLGYPVAFSLAANGLLFFFIAVELAPYAPANINLSWSLLQALPERIYGTMSNEVLLAIPFFTFMGYILERSGMAEDLLDTIGQLIDPKAAPGLPLEAVGFREPNGSRGVWQLGILVVFSGLVGYYILSQTNTKAGADFVILTICVGTVVALICALMNKMLGAKRIAISAVLTVLLVGAYVVLHQQGYEGLALTMEMVIAGAAYALVVGIV